MNLSQKYSGQQPDNISVEWFKSSLGQAITSCEIEILTRLVPKTFFRVCVQVEGPLALNYIAGIKSPVQCRVGQQIGHEKICSIVGLGEWLPFGESSIDLLVLPHVLEFSDYPHDVLREASGCVSSNGVLLITGFNPRSMLSLMKGFKRYESYLPRTVHFHSVHRVRDWLALSGFEIVAGEFAFFRPPVRRSSQLKRLEKLELAGARWWPAMGSVYILVSRKRDLGIRIKPDFSTLRFRQQRFGLEY